MKINNVEVNDAYTFPSIDGNIGQVLKTNGNRTVSWEDDDGFTEFSNDDMDTGTKVIMDLSNIFDNCAYVWYFYLTNGSVALTGKIIGSMIKTPDGYGGYIYTVNDNLESHSLGTFITPNIYVAYDSSTSKLQLKVDLLSDDWSCFGKYMKIYNSIESI